jgi:PTH1 family peptidyl-tRNA hydrolase
MILIVGLGNPGRKYAKTRHNVGFRLIDTLKNEISDKNIILFKPDTFMNNSGKTVKKELKYSKLNTQDLIVIHDDIDLPFGTIRVSKDSSSAGHKGVQSIIDELETKDFTRIRIGIKPLYEVDTTEFVLNKFTEKEEKELKKILKETVEIIKKELLS